MNMCKDNNIGDWIRSTEWPLWSSSIILYKLLVWESSCKKTKKKKSMDEKRRKTKQNQSLTSIIHFKWQYFPPTTQLFPRQGALPPSHHHTFHLSLVPHHIPKHYIQVWIIFYFTCFLKYYPYQNGPKLKLFYRLSTTHNLAPNDSIMIGFFWKLIIDGKNVDMLDSKYNQIHFWWNQYGYIPFFN